MRIDAHHHFWRYQRDEFGWIAPGLTELQRDFLPPEFERELRSAGFEHSIVVQARQSLEETRWLLGLADQWPFLSGVVGWVDLCSTDVETQIQEFVHHQKFVGVRHCVHDEPEGFLERKDFRHGLSLLQNYGLTFDLLLFPQNLVEAEELACQFPLQVFVLDHLAKPWAGTLSRREWKEQLRNLAAHPQVYAKLSGLVPEGFPPTWSKDDIQFYLETAFETFGEDRLIIGSNWPVCKPVGSYVWILQWVLEYLEPYSPQARDKILGRNAAAVYGRGDRSGVQAPP
jgi:L-fuconolactonase